MESEAHRGNFWQHPALNSALVAPSSRRESDDALQAGIGGAKENENEKGIHKLSTLKIDIETRILDDQIQVYIIHPGARYAYYDIISQNSVLPVDLPFLNIQDGEAVPDASKISAMLERARIMRKWAKRPKSKMHIPRPTRDLDYYRSSLNIENEAQGVRTRLRNIAQEILWNIPEGNLVVIPQKKITGQAILAELGSPTADRSRVYGQDYYANLDFLARPIKIINKIPMLVLPSDVISAARSTSVIQNIGGSSENRVLRLAYGDYHRNKDSVAGVISNNENFDALVLAQLIDLHIAIEYFLETGDVLSPGQVMWTRQINSTPHLHATINSPNGRASLESQGMATFTVKLLGIVAASGISLAIAGQLIANGNVSVVNSKESGECTKVIQSSRNAMVDFFNASGYDNCEEYLTGLHNGISRNAIKIHGKAEIEE